MQYELSELPGGMNLAFQSSFDSDVTNFGGQFVDVDNDGYLDIYSGSGFYTAPKEIASQDDL